MMPLLIAAKRLFDRPARRPWLDYLCLARQRRRLGALDARLLDDAGLTRSEAREEARRALWDVPRHWRG